MGSVQSRQLDTLTGLRFFAAFAVLMKHAATSLAPNLLAVAGLGYVGVSFFFVLSGFVLTYSYKPSLPLRVFYGRRIARVYPLHLMTGILAAAWILLSGGNIAILPAVLNFSLLHAWVPLERFGESLNGVSWSLSCEAFFYAMFPLVVMPIARTRRPLDAAILIVSLMIVAALAVNTISPGEIAISALYKGPWFRFGEFALGILLAANVHRLSWAPSLANAALVYAGSFMAVLVTVKFSVHHHVHIGAETVDLAMLPATCLVVAAGAKADLRGTKSIVTAKPMLLLGRSSFALYMTHAGVILAINNMPIDNRLLLPLAIIATIGIGIALHLLVEEPAEKAIRRRIGTDRRRRKQAQPVSASGKIAT